MRRNTGLLLAAFLYAAFPVDAGAGNPVTFCAAGDILLDRGCGTMIRRYGPGYLFENVSGFVGLHDIAFANLECPISARGRAKQNPITFRADTTAVLTLGRSGFTVFCLANNHMLDYGPDALLDTRRILGEHGFSSVGAGMDRDGEGSPIFLEKRGVRIALLAYVSVPGFTVPKNADTPRPAPADTARIREEIARARGGADIVIVSFHWGDEYRDRPNTEQVRLGRHAVDSGADIVIGHHPHVIQSIEKYRGRFILYSLGNFVFDQRDQVKREALVFSCVFLGREIIAPRVLPVVLPAGTFRPIFPSCVESLRITERVKRISADGGVRFREGDVALFLE